MWSNLSRKKMFWEPPKKIKDFHALIEYLSHFIIRVLGEMSMKRHLIHIFLNTSKRDMHSESCFFFGFLSQHWDFLIRSLLSISFFYFILLINNSDKKDHIMLDSGMLNEYGVPIKRQRISPPLTERVMLYVRQDNEDVYTALHVVPPTTNGLISAVSGCN